MTLNSFLVHNLEGRRLEVTGLGYGQSVKFLVIRAIKVESTGAVTLFCRNDDFHRNRCKMSISMEMAFELIESGICIDVYEQIIKYRRTIGPLDITRGDVRYVIHKITIG